MLEVTERQRDKMVWIAQYLNAHAELCHYAEIRPMTTRGLTLGSMEEAFKRGVHITMDCSESVTLICRLAGLQDPNGEGYDGYGYTGTMLAHLKHFTDWNEVHKGTLIVFGAGTGTHVVMVVQPNGENPLVYSHGSYASHAIWDLNTERTYHEGEPLTLLAIEDL